MLSQSVRSKRMEKPMSAIAGHAYCGRHNDYHKGGKMPERRTGLGRPKCATWPRWTNGGISSAGTGGTPVVKAALRSQRSSPASRATGFQQRARGGLMKSALRHRWHRILLNDAPIAVEKNGGARDGEK